MTSSNPNPRSSSCPSTTSAKSGLGSVSAKCRSVEELSDPNMQRDLDVTHGDGGGKFVEQSLRTLTTDDVQDCVGRAGPDPVGHRARIVRRPAQHSWVVAARGLELTGARNEIDGLGDRADVGGRAVLQRRPCRGGREVDRRHPAVIGVTNTFGCLTDADHDRGTRINCHWRTPPFDRRPHGKLEVKVSLSYRLVGHRNRAYPTIPRPRFAGRSTVPDPGLQASAIAMHLLSSARFTESP